MSEVLYTTKATATNGREGSAKTENGTIDTKIHPPGAKGEGTTPEDLFAAGYAACFGQALKAMSAQHDIKPESASVEAEVTLNKGDEGFFIAVKLNAVLGGISQEEAETLTNAAHQICPYSKATRDNISVIITANGESLKAAA